MLDAICELGTDDLNENGKAVNGETANRDARARITYSVFKFQKLGDDEIERLRQWLYCPACGGKAYFRKASKDGKAACFGSRYHRADCIEFKPSAQKSREEQDAIEVQQVLVEADALQIDFSLKPPKPLNASQAPSQNQPQALSANSVNQPIAPALSRATKGKPVPSETPFTEGALARRFPASGLEAANTNLPQIAAPMAKTPNLKRVASQGLEKLLHSLLRGSDLATSDLWVYTDSERKYRWRAKNLFVNFADADPTDNKPHLYWGTISHSDTSMSWLNPADSKDIGIPIDVVKDPLLTRFSIEDKRDLEGAGLILFGKCFWNKEKTRKIIQLWNNELTRIFISKIED